VTRSSGDAKYRYIASGTCELICLKQLLKELKFGEVTQMTLICDNLGAFHIIQISSLSSSGLTVFDKMDEGSELRAPQ